MAKNSQPVSFTTYPELLQSVNEIAKTRRRSRSFIITEALEKYLQNGTAPSQPAAKPTKKASR
jgi:predicted transcriptional regulator